MKINLAFGAIVGLVFYLHSCSSSENKGVKGELDTEEPFRIAFGSCAHQRDSLNIFYKVVEHNPDVFVFLGDNIYGDTWNMDTMQKKYDMLAAKPSFQRLIQQTRVLATWDDHDYGCCDYGKTYSMKEQSKALFLRFWGEPEDSERYKHEGIYHAYMFEHMGKKIQIILLDGRTFRDGHIRASKGDNPENRFFYELDYLPHTTSDSTFLGEQQWLWLEQEFQKSADVRIIGTGVQFGSEFHGYESWSNFPHEQLRMAELIKKHKANGVVFISGDMHYAEISKRDFSGVYPLYDVTASGLSMTWDFPSPNKYRVEGPVMENHFGLLSIWLGNDPRIQVEIWDRNGNQRVEFIMAVKDLKF